MMIQPLKNSDDMEINQLLAAILQHGADLRAQNEELRKQGGAARPYPCLNFSDTRRGIRSFVARDGEKFPPPHSGPEGKRVVAKVADTYIILPPSSKKS